MRQPMEVGGRPGHLRQTVESKCCSFPPSGAQGSIHTTSGAACPISSRQWGTPSFPSPLRLMGLLLSVILLLLQRVPSLGLSYGKTLSRTWAPQWLQIYPCLIDIATVSCRAVSHTETEDLSLLKVGGGERARKWCVWSRLSGFEVLSGTPRCRGTWEWKRWTKGLLRVICLLAVVH